MEPRYRKKRAAKKSLLLSLAERRKKRQVPHEVHISNARCQHMLRNKVWCLILRLLAHNINKYYVDNIKTDLKLEKLHSKSAI